MSTTVQLFDAIPVSAVSAVGPAAVLTSPAAGGRTVLGAAPEGFALPFEGQLAGTLPPQRSVLAPAVRPPPEAETLRPFQLAGFVLHGIELIGAEQPELTALRFTLSTRDVGATVEELQRTFRSTAFAGQFDSLRANVQEDLDLDRTMTISVAGVSLGLSLVYVLWLIRGGVLMGSYLSALPAWRVLDPLPVLSRVDEDTEDDDDALEAAADRGGNALRGF